MGVRSVARSGVFTSPQPDPGRSVALGTGPCRIAAGRLTPCPRRDAGADWRQEGRPSTRHGRTAGRGGSTCRIEARRSVLKRSATGVTSSTWTQSMRSSGSRTVSRLVTSTIKKLV